MHTEWLLGKSTKSSGTVGDIISEGSVFYSVPYSADLSGTAACPSVRCNNAHKFKTIYRSRAMVFMLQCIHIF